METKKIIITAILTTLSTLLVVATIIHLSCGHCGGRSSCSKANTECCASNSGCEKNSACTSKCGYKTSCVDKSKCDYATSCTHKLTTGSEEIVIEKEAVKEEVKK